MTAGTERTATETSWLYCKNCGRDPGVDAGSADPQWSFCRYCGYQLTAMPRCEYAGFWIRVAAYVIDLAVLTAVTVVPLGVIIIVAGSTLASFANVAVVFVYFAVGNGLGSTLGRRALGLRVINEAGNAPGIKIGASLFILSILSRITLGLGYLWMIRDSHKQTWHDKLCGTYVVRNPARA